MYILYIVNTTSILTGIYMLYIVDPISIVIGRAKRAHTGCSIEISRDVYINTMAECRSGRKCIAVK